MLDAVRRREMVNKTLLSMLLFSALIAGLFLTAAPFELSQVCVFADPSGLGPLPQPDYDSGWVNLPKATPHGNPYGLIYPEYVTPTETTLNHNLGTNNILVYVLADDGPRHDLETQPRL